MSDTQGAARGTLRNNVVKLSGTHTMDLAVTSILEDDGGTDIAIPSNATNIHISLIVTTAITGPATFTIGDGTDADRYGTAIAIAAATTAGSADYTSDGLDGTSHAVIVAAGAAHNITFTGAAATAFTAGVIDWSLYYETVTELTAALP